MEQGPSSGDLPSWMPFCRAAFEGDTAAIRWLIAEAALVNATDCRQGMPLHEAACKGQAAVIDILAYAADPFASHTCGWTPYEAVTGFSASEAVAAHVPHVCGLCAYEVDALMNVDRLPDRSRHGANCPLVA